MFVFTRRAVRSLIAMGTIGVSKHCVWLAVHAVNCTTPGGAIQIIIPIMQCTPVQQHRSTLWLLRRWRNHRRLWTGERRRRSWSHKDCEARIQCIHPPSLLGWPLFWRLWQQKYPQCSLSLLTLVSLQLGERTHRPRTTITFLAATTPSPP